MIARVMDTVLELPEFPEGRLIPSDDTGSMKARVAASGWSLGSQLNIGMGQGLSV